MLNGADLCCAFRCYPFCLTVGRVAYGQFTAVFESDRLVCFATDKWVFTAPLVEKTIGFLTFGVRCTSVAVHNVESVGFSAALVDGVVLVVERLRQIRHPDVPGPYDFSLIVECCDQGVASVCSCCE